MTQMQETEKAEALVLETSATAVVLMKSMGHFIVKRITDKKGKAAFHRAMASAIEVVSGESTSIGFIECKLADLHFNELDLYPKSLFNSREEERRCYALAVNTSLDILHSLNRRFITGQSDEAPRNYNGKGFLYQSQHDFNARIAE
jgi:hypothetical protein